MIDVPSKPVKLSRYVYVDKDGKQWVFKNKRGLEINNNRTIHTVNWTVEDLITIVDFLVGETE